MNPIAITNQFQNHKNPLPSLKFPMSMAPPRFNQNLQPLFDEAIPLTIQAPAAIPSECLNDHYLKSFKVFREEGQCLKDMDQYLAERPIQKKEELQAVKVFDPSLIEKALLQKDFKMLAALNRQELSIPADTIVSERFTTTMATALSENKSKDVIDFLSAIDINIQNSRGETILWTATAMELSKLVNILATMPGINPNIQDKKGYTALTTAAYLDQAEIIKILLDHPETNPNIKIHGDHTGLIISIMNNNSKIAKMFAAHPLTDPNTYCKGLTPLIIAANGNQTQIVEDLLANPKTDPNVPQKNMDTSALSAATFHGHTKIASVLLAHPKTDPNLQDNSKLTALMIAAVKNDTEIAKLLLAHPLIDLNLVCDKVSSTAFFIAASKGHLEIMNMIKLSGKDTISEDTKNFKLFSHSWEQKGNLKFGHLDIKLEEFVHFFVAEFMDSTLNAFQKQYPDLMPKKLYEQISHGFSNIQSFNPKQALQDFRSGKPIFIPGGSNTHSIIVVIHDSYLMICNKGEGSLRPIEAYKINPQLLTEEILTQVKECQDNSVEDGFDALFGKRYTYSDRLIRLNGPLLQKLRIQGESSIDEEDKLILWLSHLLSHKSEKQAVDNCAWESLETAVYATITLHLAMDGELQSSAKMVDVILKSNEIFSKWEKFTKLEAVIQVLERVRQNILTNPEVKDSMRFAFEFIDSVYKKDQEQDFWSRRQVHSKIQDIKVLMDGEGWMSMMEWIPYKISRLFN